MSMAICAHCDNFVDTDDDGDAYPYAYVHLAPEAPKSLQDLCVCETCREESYERFQEYLMEDAA